MIYIPKWKAWRLRYKILAILLVFQVGLFLSGFILIRNPQFQSYLKSEIIAAAEKNMDAQLTIKDISGNPFSYLRLQGIVMHGPFKTEAPENHLIAKEFVVRFSLWKFIRGNLGFSSIRVIQPQVYLDLKSFTKSKSKETTLRKPEFSLGWVQLTDGDITIVYSDKKYHFDHSNLTGSFSMENGITDIRVRDYSGTVEGMSIDQLRGRLTFSPDKIEAKAIRLTGQNIALDLDGELVLANTPRVNMHVKSDRLPMEHIIDLFPWITPPSSNDNTKRPATGRAQLSVDIVGPLDKLTGRGQLSVPKGQFGSIPFNQLSVKFSSETSSLLLEDISIEIFKGKFHASGNGQYIVLGQDYKTQGVVTNPVTGKIQRLPETQTARLPFNLNLIFQNIDVSQIPTVDQTLFGTLDGQVDLHGDLMQLTGTSSSLRGQGALTWNNGKYKGIENFHSNANIEIQGDTIHFPNTRITGPETEVNGNILVQIPKKVEFTMNWVSNNVSKMKSIIRISDINGPGKGQIHGLSENSKPLLMDGKFQLDSGSFETIKYNHVDGTIYPDRRLELSGSNLNWENWPVDQAKIQLQFGEKYNTKSRRIYYQEVILIKGQTQIIANGFVDGSTQQVLFNFKSDKARLEDLPVVQKQIPSVTNINNLQVAGTITGKTNNLIVNSQFNGQSFEIEHVPVPDIVNGTVVVAGKQTEFIAKGAGYNLHGNVDFKTDDPNIVLSCDMQNARLIFPWLANMDNPDFLTGTVNGSVSITGRNSNLRFLANINNVKAQVHSDTGPQNPFLQFQFSNATVFGQLQNGIQNGQLRWIMSQLTESQHQVNLQNPDFDIVWKNRQSPVVRMIAPSGSVQNIPITNLQTQFQGTGSILDISQLSLHNGEGILNFQGNMNFSKASPSYRLVFNGEKLPIENIMQIISSSQLKTPSSIPKTNISGLATGQISLVGKSLKFSEIDGEGKATIEKIRINPSKENKIFSLIRTTGQEKLISEFQIKKGRINLTNSSLNWMKSSITIGGSIGSNQELNLQFHGNIDDLSSMLVNSYGKASFDITLTRTWYNPRWTGTLEVDSGKYNQFNWKSGIVQISQDDKSQDIIHVDFANIQIGTELFDRANVNMIYMEPLLTIQSGTLTKKKSVSMIQGKINTQTGEYSGDITGKDLSISRWITTQSTGWIVDSNLDFQGQIRGNYKNQAGTFAMTSLNAKSGKSVVELQSPVRFEWNAEKLDIQPFTLISKSASNGSNQTSSKQTSYNRMGTLTGSGTISLRENKPQYYDISVIGKDFSWSIIKGIDAIYDTQLKFVGNADKPKLTGFVKFDRISVNAPIFLSAQKVYNPGTHITPLPSISMLMDLSLSADSAIYLRNELLDLQAKGWVKFVTDPSGELEITHELKTIDGFILYRSRKFPITKAEVRHTDPRVFNPYVEALAQTRIRSTDIYLRVIGPLSDYDIVLSSDPAYSQTDIFSLLATGRTQDELKNVGKSEALSEVAAGYAGEQIANTLGSPMMKAVGIDKVYTEYDEVDNESKLKVEKELSKRLSVGYSMGLSKESNSGGQVEYKLNKNLSAVGRIGVNSVTKEASGAMDLEFRIPTK